MPPCRSRRRRVRRSSKRKRSRSRRAYRSAPGPTDPTDSTGPTGPTLWLAVLTASAWGARYRSLPPSPNNWNMSLDWVQVYQGVVRPMDDVLRDLSQQYARLYNDTSMPREIIQSSFLVESVTKPAAFSGEKCYWQEEHYFIDESSYVTLENSVLECLTRGVANMIS